MRHLLLERDGAVGDAASANSPTSTVAPAGSFFSAIAAALQRCRDSTSGSLGAQVLEEAAAGAHAAARASRSWRTALYRSIFVFWSEIVASSASAEARSMAKRRRSASASAASADAFRARRRQLAQLTRLDHSQQEAWRRREFRNVRTTRRCGAAGAMHRAHHPHALHKCHPGPTSGGARRGQAPFLEAARARRPRAAARFRRRAVPSAPTTARFGDSSRAAGANGGDADGGDAAAAAAAVAGRAAGRALPGARRPAIDASAMAMAVAQPAAAPSSSSSSSSSSWRWRSSRGRRRRPTRARRRPTAQQLQQLQAAQYAQQQYVQQQAAATAAAAQQQAAQQAQQQLAAQQQRRGAQRRRSSRRSWPSSRGRGRGSARGGGGRQQWGAAAAAAAAGGGGGGGRQQGGSWNANAPAFAPGTAGGDGGATVPLQPDNPAGSGPSMVVRPGQHLTPTQQSQFVAGAAPAGLRRTGQSSRHDALFLPANLRADLAREAAAAAFAGHPNDTRLEELFSVQAARRPATPPAHAAPRAPTPRARRSSPLSPSRALDEVRQFHSLVPLDDVSRGKRSRLVGGGNAPVYKATSDVDGETYVLRCVEGATAPAEGMQRAAGWHALSHPNLVGLKEVFVSDPSPGRRCALSARPHHPQRPVSSSRDSIPSHASFPHPSRRPRHLLRRGATRWRRRRRRTTWETRSRRPTRRCSVASASRC